MPRLSEAQLRDTVKRLRKENSRLRRQAEGRALMARVLSFSHQPRGKRIGFVDLRLSPWNVVLRDVSVFYG